MYVYYAVLIEMTSKQCDTQKTNIKMGLSAVTFIFTPEYNPMLKLLLSYIWWTLIPGLINTKNISISQIIILNNILL